MIKIISGKYKRSNLIVHDKYVRPTSLIKRESIFSVIESYAVKNNINLYDNKAALDDNSITLKKVTVRRANENILKEILFILIASNTTNGILNMSPNESRFLFPNKPNS